MNRTYRTLALVAAVAIAGFGYWHLVLGPKRAQLAAVDASIASAQSTLAQTRMTAADYRKAERAYRTNYASVVRLGKAVPADDDVRSMLVQLDKAAGDSQVSFSDIELGGGSGGPAASTDSAASSQPVTPGAVAVGGAGFSQLPLTFTFDGSYEGLTKFFARLDRFVTVRNKQLSISGRLLRIESMNIAPGTDGWPSLTAKITASSYLVPATQGLTAGATSSTPATAASATATATATPTTTPSTTTTATTGVLR